MNRIKIRRPSRTSARAAKVAIQMGVAGLAAMTFSGCGAGQISQTTAQEPAVNGNRLTINNVALRDIRIQAVQNSDFLRPGRTVDLVLVAINQSPEIADQLISISSDIGAVTVSGDTRLPANGMLFIGTPDGQKVAPGPLLRDSKAAKATVTLTKPITNGLTYNFTFNFEKAGQASAIVPISAGLATAPEQPSSANHS